MNQDKKAHTLIGVCTAIITVLMLCYFFYSTNRLALDTLAISFISGIAMGIFISLNCFANLESF